MRLTRIVATATTVVVAGAGVVTAAPAFAATHKATSTTTHRTSLTATPKSGRASHTDKVTLRLRRAGKGVSGEDSNFVVRMRKPGHAWSSWETLSATPGTQAGNYRSEVVLPASATKGSKEQYQVKFTGDSARNLHSSRSHVFAVTEK